MAQHIEPNIVTDGLVLSLDAADKNSYPGSGTTWYDLSGAGSSNGAAQGSPTYSSAGGGSFDFDHGSTDCFNVTLNKSYNNLDLTIENWCLLDNGAVDSMLWCFRASGNGPDLLHSVPTNEIALNTWDGVVNSYDRTWTSHVDVWYHNVVTFEYGVDSKLYWDGTYQGDANYASPYNDQLGVGGNFGAGTYSHSGLIANCRVYDRVLSTKEISQNFNAQRSRFGI